MQKFCYFYAEIVKFGLILTHLKLFCRGKLRGQENILGEANAPMPPPPMVPPLSRAHIYATCPKEMYIVTDTHAQQP